MAKQQIGIRELAEQAKQSGAYDLAQGVIDAPPPPVLLDNLRELSLEKYSSYNNKRGVPAYREALQKYLSDRGWRLPLESIISSAGAMGGITAALLTDCRPGDTVLLPEPFFVYHKLQLETLGFNIHFEPVPLNAEPDWTVVEQRMSEAQAFILTTPSNPQGYIAPPDLLERLSRTAIKSKCLLILDEMYREFIWDEEKPDDSKYRNIDLKKTVIVRSFSKTFAIPGWRAGFTVTSPDRAEQMAIRHDALYIGGSTISQNALAVTLQNNVAELRKYIADLRQLLLNNREILEQAFKKNRMEPIIAPATYYMLMKHNRASDAAAAQELLEKKIVAVPANILFSNQDQDTGYIRIHFGVSRETATAVSRILNSN